MIEPTVAVRQMPMAQHASVGRYCVGARSVRAQCVTPDMRGRRPKAALALIFGLFIIYAVTPRRLAA